MKHQRIILWIGILILLGLLPLLISRALTGPGRPEFSEFPGLRETPDIPVGSIILRRHFPEHPSVSLPPGPGGGCDKDVDLTSTISGVVAVATQNNKICTSADIDTYIAGTNTYVVQAGGQEAAWIHTDVTSPSSPVLLGSFKWSGSSTYTPDVKTFSQTRTVDGTETTRHFINLSLERLSSGGFCGVVIVDVTDPSDPILVTQIYKNDPDDFWCDVHNSFVEDDPSGSGEGRYIYLTADARNDMRVLDINDVNTLPNPCDVSDTTTCNIEIGRYTSPTANNNNYVHDVTVLDHGSPNGRRAYLSYWDTGLVILDAADVTPNADFDINPIPIVGPNNIDPSGFLTHHAFASEDGSLVFIQDEFLNSSDDEPVQMWDVSDPPNPTYVDGLVLGSDVPVNPPHNLEIRYDLDFDGDGFADPNRLFVGWYKMGLQAWDFDGLGFVRYNPEPRTAVIYHQVQTEGADDKYDGAWGVRLEEITTDSITNLYIFQSDRRYGLIVDKVTSGCTTSADCNDANECTTDTCGVDGVCSNTSVADNTTCNAGSGLCCGGLCNTPSCTAGGGCNDGDACTTDSCLNAGTCSATCSNTWPACGASDSCCGPDCNGSTDLDCSTCSPSGATCLNDTECCSGKCRGKPKPGAKTCKG